MIINTGDTFIYVSPFIMTTFEILIHSYSINVFIKEIFNEGKRR